MLWVLKGGSLLRVLRRGSKRGFDRHLEQALCCALALQNRAVFEGRQGRKLPSKGEEKGWPTTGEKREKGSMKTSHYVLFLPP